MSAPMTMWSWCFALPAMADAFDWAFMEQSLGSGVSLQWISSPGEGMTWKSVMMSARSSLRLGEVEARMMSGCMMLFCALSNSFVEADACGYAYV